MARHATTKGYSSDEFFMVGDYVRMYNLPVNTTNTQIADEGVPPDTVFRITKIKSNSVLIHLDKLKHGMNCERFYLCDEKGKFVEDCPFLRSWIEDEWTNRNDSVYWPPLT